MFAEPTKESVNPEAWSIQTNRQEMLACILKILLKCNYIEQDQ